MAIAQRRPPAATTVAVLLGGLSPEREVSLASGAAVLKALQELGFDAYGLEAGRDIASVLERQRPDVAFNALHGYWGEDGLVQGILETLEIPYTHSGVMASALAMDKPRAKALFAASGLPVAAHKLVTLEEAASEHPLPPPYVIKPAAQGSSVGVRLISRGSNAPPPDLARQRDLYGDHVMIERYIPGHELTCTVMGERALGVTDIIPSSQFYDYNAKYAEGGSRHVIPAQIPQTITQQVQDHALAAHRALGCRGLSRADFRYDPSCTDGPALALLEVNTQPGMTSTSLSPEAARHAGYDFPALVAWLVEDASCRR